MSDADAKVAAKLRNTAGYLFTTGELVAAAEVADGVFLIERLKAEVERLTPKPMTLEEACDVLNEKNHLFTSTWMVRAGGVGSDGKPLVISEQDIITGSEAIWIAQGLLRDAGPSSCTGEQT